MCCCLEYVYECMHREFGPVVRYCDGRYKLCHECELHGKDTEPGEIPCPGKHEGNVKQGSGDVEERSGPCLECRESVLVSERDIYAELQYRFLGWEECGQDVARRIREAMERRHLRVIVGTRPNPSEDMRFDDELRKFYKDESRNWEKVVRFLAKHVKDGDKYVADFLALLRKIEASHEEAIREVELKALNKFRRSAIRNLRNLSMA
jgi:hypothetical protein